MRTWWVLVAALGVSAAEGEGEASGLRIELRKKEDSAVVTSAAGAEVVAIASHSGIGGATLIRVGNAWPPRLTIRLSVRNLELLEMGNGVIRFSGSLKTAGQTPYWKAGKAGDEKPDGFLEVEMNRTEDGVEVVVPKAILEGEPERIDVGWINEFRG